MDAAQTLTTLNEFYDQAFNRLLIVTFGVLALIGGLVPVAVGWVQKRSLRNEKESLLREVMAQIKEEIDGVHTSAQEAINNKIQHQSDALETKFQLLSKKIQDATDTSRAQAYHLQANHFRTQGYFVNALSDFSSAAMLYIQTGDEGNGRRCAELIEETCLPVLNKDNYIEYECDQKCEQLIKFLEETNENKRYSRLIARIKTAMRETSKRDAALPGFGASTP